MADGNANFLVQINGQNNTQQAFDGVLTAAQKLGAALGVGLGLNELKNQVVESIKAFGDQQAVMAQTEAVIASTGGVAGVTSQEVADLAGNYQNLTQFSDETVGSAENLLLTFTKISSDIFPQATETTLDMAQALGEDTKSAAIQLGKALQDPILGATALRRVGVNLSDSQQELIKGFVNSGQSAKAQALIMNELKTEFGGSATMFGKTIPGQLAIMGNQFDEVKEKIGGFLGAAMAPLLTKVLEFVRNNQQMIAAMAIAAIGTVAIGAALYGLASAFAALSIAALPVIGALGIIAALVGVTLYRSVRDVMDKTKGLNGALGDTKKAAGDAAGGTGALTDAQKKLGDQLAEIKKEIEDENASFQENLAEMIKGHQDKVDDLKTQLAEENRTFTDNEDDKLRKFRETIAGMELDHQRFLDDNKLAVDEENAAYSKAYQQKLDDYTKKINLERQAGTEVSQLKVADLQKQLGQELSDLDESHASKLAKLQTSLTRENQDYSTHYEQTNQQYQEDTQKAKVEHDKKVDDTSKQLVTEQTLLSKHQSEVSSVRDFAFRDEIQKLEDAHAKTLQSYADQAKKAKETAAGTTSDFNNENLKRVTDAQVSGAAMGDAMAKAFKDAAMKAIKDLPRNFVGTIASGFDVLGGWADSAASKITGKDVHTETMTETLNKIWPAPHAKGGHMSAGEVGTVGEEGTELWVPDSPGTVVPSGKFGNTTVQVVIQGDLHVDSEQRKDDLVREIAFLLGRQGSLAKNGVI